MGDYASTFSGITGGLSDIANIGIGIGNYKLQKKMFKYQKELQKQIFQREDTAVQRRVGDLEAAGMSKVLAAGSAAGSGGVVATNTPQMQPVPDVSKRIDQMYALKRQQAEIETTAAQKELINQQANTARSQELLNQENLKTQRTQQSLNLANARSSDARAALTAWDLRNYMATGRTSTSSELGKTFGDIVGSGVSLGSGLSEVKKKLDDSKAAKANAAKATYQFNTNTNSWERRKVK